ncbi:MAG: hypothetical protein M1837_004398 [Sclerophora amabilis]|nr:MAG: hypothetical protein M1837_004398 [Sclerophora amabilis]
MNGNGYRRPSQPTVGEPGSYVQSSPHPNGPRSTAPPGKVLLDGYKESMANPQEERRRYNPLNPSRPRSSALLNVNDPVAMHLLVETALGDSQVFEVLSFEEVDEMKKEYTFLANRIDASKRKLGLESKVRDAAESLSRLYSKKGRRDNFDTSPQRNRRSLLGSRSGSDVSNKTDDELTSSLRRCEELSQEIWRLERRATDIQRRLLHHTAGILQMTHGATITKSQVQTGGTQQARPGSPESIYTYSNSRSSMTPRDDLDEFDERSLYRPSERSEEYGRRQKSRSPGRPRSSDFGHEQTITVTEGKIEELNQRLRGLIVQTNPQQDQSYQSPPRVLGDEASGKAGASLQAQLNYLEQGLSTLDIQHNDVLRNAEQSNQAIEERLEDLNTRLQEFIIQMGFSGDKNYNPPPQASGRSPEFQIEYLEQGLDLVQQQLPGMAGNSESQDQLEQFQTVLTGLWDIIKSGEEERKSRERSKRQATGDTADDEEGFSSTQDTAGEFSLQSFSAKVQWLCGRIAGLMEEKDVLRRQIQQQRELNNKSDSAKDAEREQLAEELNHYKHKLDQSDREAEKARQELVVVMQRLDAARKESTLRSQQRSSEDSALMRDLQRREEEVMNLEATLEELKDDHGIARAELQGQIEERTAKIERLHEELQAAVMVKEDMEAREQQLMSQVEDKTKQAKHVEGEMERMEGEVVRLQTEVTVARAELDGAYGTRAQRAAEVAVNPALQKEKEDLAERNKALSEEINALNTQRGVLGGTSGDMQHQIQTLKAELADTIEEYESMTKQSIEFEKEREQLENIVDGLRDRCESLESQLSEERVKWLGMRSPGPGGKDGGQVDSTSTATLKNEFKKMMRDTRAENTKVLRAEQEERRKLENLVRTLKKEQGQRKSGLSQSVIA